MRALILTVFMLASGHAFAVDGFGTSREFSDDFATARPCEAIDGRLVWAGQRAFYIQSWQFMTGQSGLLDPENASAVPIADNDKAALQPFEDACD